MSTRYGRNPGAAQGNVMLYANGTHPVVSVWAREKNPDGSIGGYVLDKNGKKVELNHSVQFSRSVVSDSL